MNEHHDRSARPFSRRNVLCALSLALPLALASGVPSVLAENAKYPERTIRFVVPWSPGGQNDIWARILAQEANGDGFNVIVENIAGASGIVGMQAVASAEPDGYTIGQASGSTLAAAALGMSTFSNDDLRPLVLASTEPLLLVVAEESRFKTAEEFMAALKAGETVTIGTPGTQNINHLFAQTLGYVTEGEYSHIPYPGGAQVLTDLRGGQIDAAVLGPSLAIQNFQNHTLRGLAIFAHQRLEVAPDVPTFAEVGYDVFPFGSINQISYVVAPAGLPDDIAAILTERFRNALASDAVKQFADANGNTLFDITGEDLKRSVDDTQTALNAAVKELFAGQ